MSAIFYVLEYEAVMRAAREGGPFYRKRFGAALV